MQKRYFVYIATNKRNTVLYTGVTGDIERRAYEHRNKLVKGFTAKYNVDKIVYYEEFYSPREAIAAEKRIKGWNRERKINLIKKDNPEFKDLLPS